MLYAFENEAYKINNGEISKPFRTRYGYHILKRTDTRTSLECRNSPHFNYRYNFCGRRKRSTMFFRNSTKVKTLASWQKNTPMIPTAKSKEESYQNLAQEEW